MQLCRPIPLVLTLASLTAGCGSETASPGANPEPTADAAAEPAAVDGGSDSAAEEDWLPLISGPWSMPAGEEGYVCVRHTLEEDLLVGAFEAVNPPGTHHTLLTVGDPDAEDGVTDCTAGDNQLYSLYGSGVGTNPMIFPEGVAVRIEAGKQLLLNLHLFNTTTEEMTGSSGTRFRPLPEEELVHEAEGFLAGTVALDIPPHEENRARRLLRHRGGHDAVRRLPAHAPARSPRQGRRGNRRAGGRHAARWSLRFR